MTGLRRWRTVSLVSLALLISIGAAGASAATAGPAAASSGPSCTFNGSSFPIVTGRHPGSTVQFDCTGLPTLHPYLLLEISLVVAIDPSTAGLLSGDNSPSLLLSVLSAVPQINPAALAITTSDSSGNLSYAYKTPTTQALDPNASCPPSTEEFNSGLVGCALALVDLTTAKEVPAGSALLEYSGFPFLPPNPTLAVSPKDVSVGQAVTVSDKPGATTYWWLATLASLEGDLGGTPPPPSIVVNFNKERWSRGEQHHGRSGELQRLDLHATRALGTFIVPSWLSAGKHGVLVFYQATLEGVELAIDAHKAIVVSS